MSHLPASLFGGTQNTLSSSDPTHSGADKVEWTSPSDFCIVNRRGLATAAPLSTLSVTFHLSLWRASAGPGTRHRCDF